MPVRSWVFQHRGFTVLELVVVVSIIAILAGLLLPVLGRARRDSHAKMARAGMSSLIMGFEKYRDDYGTYPPQDTCGATPVSGDQAGSEIVCYYLCTRFQWGEMHYGPYLENINLSILKDANGNGLKEYVSPLIREQAQRAEQSQGYYRYIVVIDPERKKAPQFVLVDAGVDGLFGGTLDPLSGFVPDGTDADQDGAPDDRDNIYSHAK